jgi:ribosomal protein S18 acetylase RimI-like enzyme
MSASDHLSQQQLGKYAHSDLTYKYDDGGIPRSNSIEAYKGSNQNENTYAGFISWHPETGHIGNIVVADDHRHRGVATHLLKEANKQSEEKGLIAPKHSSNLSKAGKAWKKSLKKPTSPTK